MRVRRKSWLLLPLALLVGCQSVVVQSFPYGAEVFVDGERVGKTPCKFKASTVIGCEYLVEVRAPGYRPYSELVETEWGPGSTWNLLSSLIFLSPLIILTPFFGDVVPGAVYVQLEPEPAPPAYPLQPEAYGRPDEEVH
jgi:hypothetical protein